MKTDKAFTLIELLIVMAILGLIVSIGIPQTRRVFRTNLKTSSLQLAGFIKFAYDTAIIKQRIHRIVFDLKAGVYMLEVANTEDLVTIDDEMAEDEEDTVGDHTTGEHKKIKKFVSINGSMGEKKKLASGIFFENIENIVTKKVFNDDLAYLYFFPHGMTEDVIIRLRGISDSTGFYSLKVNSINAKCKIAGRYLEE